MGADPSLDGPVASDAGAWTPERPADDAPWGAPDGATLNPDSAGSGPDADSRGPARDEDSDAWSPAAPADDAYRGGPERPRGSGLSWDAPVGADPILDGPVASDAGAWTPERPADDAPWGAPVGADPILDGPVGSDAGAWTPGDPAVDTRWGAPDGAIVDAAAGRDDDAWDPARPEDTDGWTPVPAADDLPRGSARDWEHDELGSRSWGDERRPDPRDEGTEGLESWAPAREGEDAWASSADPEPWTGDRYADELSPQAPPPGPAASGNTWAFDRDDLRLPDVVREAEQRRRETASGPEYQDWGGGSESPADPLAAIADLQSRAQESGAHGYDEPVGYDDGATRMFDAPAYDAPGRDESGYDAPGYDAPEYGASGYDDPGYDGPREAGATQMFDAPAYDAPRRDESGHDAPEYDAPGYDSPGYDAPEYDAPGYDDPGYDGPREGGATQMFDAYAEDDGYDGPVPQGAPSDVAPLDRRDESEPESEYEDGFTPADYGMPARPEPRKRRKDPIADDFPGFGDRPLGGEAGDAYPGYDSIDHLADTERGALVTLWLGLASLLPGIGLVTAVLALAVTGPKAKRAIRGSHGQLDGLGLITAGTVLAVVGILVTVVSALVFFLF
ncbi:hypothetical protein ADL05_08295 [Nocardiopsis sp. NRRL B-16309]|nr:hypothetical protein ADL05_08295 [Nocardiopsis sp. NRRL B-16309]